MNNQYNESEENRKDDLACIYFAIPAGIILLIISAIWTYANWLNAL